MEKYHRQLDGDMICFWKSTEKPEMEIKIRNRQFTDDS